MSIPVGIAFDVAVLGIANRDCSIIGMTKSDRQIGLNRFLTDHLCTLPLAYAWCDDGHLYGNVSQK
ncbi:hypothetical protein N8723_02255 [Luminiphilus sp.]|nr:hypothetical protein [Luminiphilus sp.]MDA8678932.1 hypothetical protein [Luminiphilus sp.]